MDRYSEQGSKSYIRLGICSARLICIACCNPTLPYIFSRIRRTKEGVCVCVCACVRACVRACMRVHYFFRCDRTLIYKV